MLVSSLETTPKEVELDRFWAIFLLMVFDTALCAQSIIRVNPYNCDFRAGDDPTWAAPQLEESAWYPYKSWELNPDQARIWVRCSVDLSELRNVHVPAIQITTSAASEVFVDGRRIGGSGNMRNGLFTYDIIHSWPIRTVDLHQSAMVAIRLAYRVPLDVIPTAVYVGELDSLNNLHDSVTQAAIRSNAFVAILYVTTAIVGIVQIVLFFRDRSQLAVLLLGIVCLSLSSFRLMSVAERLMLPIPVTVLWFTYFTANLLLTIAELGFLQVISSRKVMRSIQMFLAISVSWSVAAILSTVAPIAIALRLLSWLVHPPAFDAFLVATPLALIGAFLTAFFPIRKIPRHLRPIAALCAAWLIADLVWFVFELAWTVPDLFHLYRGGYDELVKLRGFTVLAVTVSVTALLLHDQPGYAAKRRPLGKTPGRP